MKPINNTCKEKLNSLLEKTCTSTIRKAWKDCSCEGDCQEVDMDGNVVNCICECKLIIEKPAQYKVGDIVDNLIEL